MLTDRKNKHVAARNWAKEERNEIQLAFIFVSFPAFLHFNNCWCVRTHTDH